MRSGLLLGGSHHGVGVGQPDQRLLLQRLEHAAKGGGAGRRAHDERMHADRDNGGGPVGISTLAVAVGEEPATVEEVCEPYLVRLGMLARTPRGRVATAAAWTHLGLSAPRDAAGQVPPTLFDESDPAHTAE